MTEIRFPLGLSVAGHAVCLALLIGLLPTRIPPLPEPAVPAGIAVVFAPLPKPEEQPGQPQMPPLQAETPPSEPEPTLPEPAPPEPPMPEQPVAATELPQPPEPQPPLPEQQPPPVEPPPPAVETPAPVTVPPPPPAPRKIAARPPAKPSHRGIEKAQPSPTALSAQLPPATVAAPQTAYAPAPPVPIPSPEVSRGYGALVSAWLNSHKRYPESARQRGEEGGVHVRFEIDRTGRVVDFAITKSSGYPELDTAVDKMIRNATFPPFPAGMTESRFPVVVTLTFRLER